jgi:hypothetical protein
MFQQKLFGLRQWLQVANPADQPRRHTNRVLWILNDERYINWRTTPASAMWLYGKPGCGKSNYCTTILEDLFQRCDGSLAGVSAHYYLSYQEQAEDRRASPHCDRH